VALHEQSQLDKDASGTQSLKQTTEARRNTIKELKVSNPIRPNMSNNFFEVKIAHSLEIGMITLKSYYDSLTHGWGDNGQDCAKRNPPASTVNKK
jgi:hypothetical protein